MSDLDIAKELLSEKVNIAFVKKGKTIFCSDEEGVKGFLAAIKNLGEELQDSSIADKIAGRAVALLCMHVKIKSLYAKTMSESCIRVLQNSGIAFGFEKVVKNILNKDKTDMCPLEKLVSEISDPQIGFEKLNSFINRSV